MDEQSVLEMLPDKLKVRNERMFNTFYHFEYWMIYQNLKTSGWNSHPCPPWHPEESEDLPGLREGPTSGSGAEAEVAGDIPSTNALKSICTHTGWNTDAVRGIALPVCIVTWMYYTHSATMWGILWEVIFGCYNIYTYWSFQKQRNCLIWHL